MSFLDPKTKNPAVRKAALAVATGFGLGFAPVASGTFGAVLGCGIVLAFTALSLPVAWQVAVCAALSALCVPVASIAEKDLARGKDPGAVVCDEYLTFPICMIGMTDLWIAHPWLMPACFAVNRFFDVVKPFPAYRLQALPSGLGIAIDDFLVSIYALAANWALYFAATRLLGI